MPLNRFHSSRYWRIDRPNSNPSHQRPSRGVMRQQELGTVTFPEFRATARNENGQARPLIWGRDWKYRPGSSIAIHTAKGWRLRLLFGYELIRRKSRNHLRAGQLTNV